MRQKILDKLKANRTEASKDVTDITLEAQVDLLLPFIPDDEALGKLDAAKAILSMQGNINFTASAAAKAEREKLNQKTPEQIAAEKVEADKIAAEKLALENKGGGMTPEQIAEIVKLATAPLLEKINGIEGGNAKAAMIDAAKLAITEKYQLEDSEMAGSNYIFDMISDREHADTDAFVGTYEAEYNKFRTANGAGNVVPKSSIVINPDDPKEDTWAKGIREQRAAAIALEVKANERINGKQ